MNSISPNLNIMIQACEKASKVIISNSVRGVRQKWVELAEKNTLSSINTKILSKKNMFNRFQALQDFLKLDEMPKKLECFDISHTFGEETVASCVSFSVEGPQKKDYRKFNIRNLSLIHI